MTTENTDAARGGVPNSWSSLAAARRAKEEAAARQEQSAKAVQDAIAETDQLGHLLAKGNKENPMELSADGRIAASSEFIAETLLALARAAIRFPGLKYVDDRYYPTHGLGHIAGLQLWNLAAQQPSPPVMLQEVSEARSALMPTPGMPRPTKVDTESGMLEVFRRFDGLGTEVMRDIELKAFREAMRPSTPPAAPTLAPATDAAANAPASGEPEAPMPALASPAGPTPGMPDLGTVPAVSSDSDADQPDEQFIAAVLSVLKGRAVPTTRDPLLTAADLPVGGRSYGKLSWMADQGLIRSGAKGYLPAKQVKKT